MFKRVGMVVVALAIALHTSGCCCCFPVRDQISRAARTINTGDVQREPYRVSLDDASRVDVTLQFGGGSIQVTGGSDDLMNGEFVYNLQDLEPEIEYRIKGTQGELHLQHKEDTIRWDRSITQVRNEWTVQFTERVPLKLQANVGASTGEFDLSGLMITDLELTTGAAEMTVRFDKPNPERLKSMRIHSGAARLELLQLGNANLDAFEFDGGLGTYTFDFRGDWKRSASAHIQAGASDITIRVPQNIGVRICPNDPSRGNYDGLQEQEGCYANTLYDRSDIQLDISLDIGLGKLDIKQTN